MLTILLLICQASSEWVEISQQHHIKPLRPASALNIHKEPDGTHTTLEKTTGANRIYLNNSLPDHGWNKYNNFQPSKDYANRLSDDIYRNTESYVIREDTYHDEEEKSDNVRIKTQLSNNKVSFDKNVEDATKVFVTYKHQGSTTFRPLRIQAEDIYKGKPIEVVDLSDLEYGQDEDVFSTVKITDDLKFSSFKDVNKRLTVNVSPEPEPMKALHNDYKWKSNTNNRTNSIFLNTDTLPKTEKRPLYPVTETSTRPIFKKTTIQNNINNDFILSDKQNNKNKPNSEVYESKDVIDIKHVNIVSESTNYAQTTANNIKNFNKLKTDPFHDSFENDEMDPNSNKEINNIGETKPFQTNLIPFKKINTLNPEEVMVKEILQDEVKGNDKLQVSVAPNKLPDVKILENDERISNPEYTVYKPHNLGIVKRLNHSGVQEEIFKIFKMKEKSTNPTGTTMFLSDTSTSTPKITNNTVHNKVDRELAGVYMNEDVEIIKHVLVTSTEEIPIRTTVKVKPFTKTTIEEGNSHTDEYSKYSPINSMTENKSQEEKKNHERNHEHMKNKQNVIIMKQRNPYKKDETQKYADDAPAASPHDFEVKQSTEKIKNNTEGTEESVTKDKNADTMKNLIKFLRIVTDTISQNTRKSFKGKLQYLEDLRDTIMANIEDRIDSAFPDDDGPKRRGRSATARGQHVEFPSAESALMTISFLTFAVYLIKLVLQVIHTYKNKTMMVPAVMASVGRVYQATRS